MDFRNINDIKNNGYEGFVTVSKLWNDRSCIPKIKGVYLVLNMAFDRTEYIYPGVGGFFKNKDPNVSIAELKSHHVENSPVVYIGKAGSPTGGATLHSRLGEYLAFGQTKKIGHWGGRLIWQLKNHSELVFCWKPTPADDPREIEKQMLAEYINQFGMRPFSNLTG